MIRRLQQVEVFEGLGGEETFHSILRLPVNIAHVGVVTETVRRLTPTLDRRENLPSPLAVWRRGGAYMDGWMDWLDGLVSIVWDSIQPLKLQCMVFHFFCHRIIHPTTHPISTIH